LRYVKGDSLKVFIFLVGVIIEAVIAVAALLLAPIWFLYLVASIVTGVLIYFLVVPLLAQTRLTVLGRPSKPKAAQTEVPEVQPRVITILETQVLKLMESEWGLGFTPIHAQIIWAMSKGNHTTQEIATFLHRKVVEVFQGLNFMKEKGVFPPHRFPSASRATAWARDLIEEAERLSHSRG
jgi:hypothetical protein